MLSFLFNEMASSKSLFMNCESETAVRPGSGLDQWQDNILFARSDHSCRWLSYKSSLVDGRLEHELCDNLFLTSGRSRAVLLIAVVYYVLHDHRQTLHEWPASCRVMRQSRDRRSGRSQIEQFVESNIVLSLPTIFKCTATTGFASVRKRLQSTQMV